MSITCVRNSVTVTVTGGTLDLIYTLDNTDATFNQCRSASFCSQAVPQGHLVETNLSNASGFTYTCPGGSPTAAVVTQTNPTVYSGTCGNDTLNGNYDVTATVP